MKIKTDVDNEKKLENKCMYKTTPNVGKAHNNYTTTDF